MEVKVSSTYLLDICRYARYKERKICLVALIAKGECVRTWYVVKKKKVMNLLLVNYPLQIQSNFYLYNLW